MDRKKIPDTLVPKTAVLELTYRCNHRCFFCSVPWESRYHDYVRLPELTVAEWKKCVDCLIVEGIRNIAFSGGEPTLKKGFEEILFYAAKQMTDVPVFDDAGTHSGYRKEKISISVITNGERITPYWVDVFKKSGCVLTVSLPGIRSFKELTGGGNYKRVLKSIQMLSDAGLDVVVSICVSKKNLPELFENISLGFLNGARQLLLNRFLPGGRGIDYAHLCLTRDEIAQMLDIAEEVCKHANTPGSVGTELPRCMLKKEYTKIRAGTTCSGGVDFFAVDPSGRVRPCNHSPVCLGDFRDIKAAIAGRYWQKFKKKDFLPKECAGCTASFECDGGCREAAHIVGGQMDSLDPCFIAEGVSPAKVTCL